MRTIHVALLLCCIAAKPHAESAQPPEQRPALCRTDGLPGGNIDVTATRTRCGASPYLWAANTAAERARDELAERCPPLDVRQAEARCRVLGKRFAPGTTPSLEATNSAGNNAMERESFRVEAIGDDGRCALIREREVVQETRGNCGFPFFQPRQAAEVTVRGYCGYVCR